MNTTYHKFNFSFLFRTLCLGLVFLATFAACKRDYEAPPLTEPKYNGPSGTITLAQLKQKYADIKTPTVIEEDHILRVVISGNDISGNIYKQLYAQDETAGINIGIDQNTMYTTYRVGQEVYIKLKGLAMVKYGDELQLAFNGTNANRIAWEIFNKQTSLSGWPNAQNVQPLEVDLSKLDASMVNKLVIIKGVRFVNEGKKNFTTGDATTNEQIKDANGKTLDVRTSNFSTFAKDKLPVGKGTLVGMLGRFNGGWQLFLREKTDIKDFDGKPSEGTTPTDPTEEIIFKETFGTKTNSESIKLRIADFTDFDMKAPVIYTEESGKADVRSIKTDENPHVWLPAKNDITFTVKGIPTKNTEGLTLSYQLAANVFTPTDAIDLNIVKLKINGVSFNVPSTIVSTAAGDKNNTYRTITIPNITKAENTTIEFSVAGDANTFGLRLDNIIIKKVTNVGGGIIVPNK